MHYFHIVTNLNPGAGEIHTSSNVESLSLSLSLEPEDIDETSGNWNVSRSHAGRLAVTKPLWNVFVITSNKQANSSLSTNDPYKGWMMIRWYSRTMRIGGKPESTRRELLQVQLAENRLRKKTSLLFGELCKLTLLANSCGRAYENSQKDIRNFGPFVS